MTTPPDARSRDQSVMRAPALWECVAIGVGYALWRVGRVLWRLVMG